MKNLLTVTAKSINQQKENNGADREEGIAHLDSYISRPKMLEKTLMDYTSEIGLRTIGSILLSIAVLLRGDNDRKIELADISLVDLDESEGFSKGKAMAIITNRSKTNKSGKVEYTGIIRNKSVKSCAINECSGTIFLCKMVKGNSERHS